MLKLLITRPSYETTTKYLFAWNEKVIKKAKIKRVETTDLVKEKATKRNFIDNISRNRPDLVFLNGHGAPHLITGHNSEILVEAGVNEQVLTNKHVHALSCETGKILGPSAVKVGAKSYIGYKEPFVFVTTKGRETKPLRDKRAAYFLDPAIEVSLSLLDDDSPEVATKNSQKAFLKNIRLLSTSGKKETYLIRYLLWNIKYQVCLVRKR